ncbi:MAG: tetratricopeptide repeat protein, partial [Candidatus Marsarchaeota archaeon]|nr:tetratricopeptide repeat protein [Candidatus Marsarchaeota archaeon]
QSAEQALIRAHALDPADELSDAALGNIAWEDGDIDGALVFWRASANLSALKSAGRELINRHDYDHAARVLAAAAGIAPHDALLYLWLGEAQLDGGDSLAAARSFQQAVRLAPDNVWGYLSLAAAYRQAGDFDSADKWCLAGVASGDPTARTRSSQCLFENRFSEGAHLSSQQQWAAAANAYRAAITSNPKDGRAYIALGGILAVRMNSEQEARQYLLRGIELSPDDIWGYIEMGWIELRHANQQEARGWAGRAQRIDPNNSSLLMLLQQLDKPVEGDH